MTTTQRRVLVVDDEPGEREGLAQLVGRLGYQVEVAENAEAALELVETFHPAVVMTDLMLPGIDGLELLQQLKGLAHPPAVLLIPVMPLSNPPSRPCGTAPTTSSPSRSIRCGSKCCSRRRPSMGRSRTR